MAQNEWPGAIADWWSLFWLCWNEKKVKQIIIYLFSHLSPKLPKIIKTRGLKFYFYKI